MSNLKHMRGDRRILVQSVIDACEQSRDGLALGLAIDGSAFRCLGDEMGMWYAYRPRERGNNWPWRETQISIIRNYLRLVKWVPHDPISPLERLAEVADA